MTEKSLTASTILEAVERAKKSNLNVVLQKPMPYTFEELLTVNRETVYLEYRYPEYNSGYRRTSWVRGFLCGKTSPNPSLYGKTWRCWERMPSEKETKNAEWMEKEEQK